MTHSGTSMAGYGTGVYAPTLPPADPPAWTRRD